MEGGQPAIEEPQPGPDDEATLQAELKAVEAGLSLGRGRSREKRKGSLPPPEARRPSTASTTERGAKASSEARRSTQSRGSTASEPAAATRTGSPTDVPLCTAAPACRRA